MNQDPNSRQVGGTHYSHKTGTQHWDIVVMADAGYLPGQITKYTERHSRKNKREDLEKALHFAEKWASVEDQRRDYVPWPFAGRRRALLADAIREYAVDAGLSAIQQRIFEVCLLSPDPWEAVRLCRVHIYREYGEPEIPENRIPAIAFGETPGTPEDGGHHAALADAIEDALTAEHALQEELPRGDESTDVDLSFQDTQDTVTEHRYVDGVDQEKTGSAPRKRGKE